MILGGSEVARSLKLGKSGELAHDMCVRRLASFVISIVVAMLIATRRSMGPNAIYTNVQMIHSRTYASPAKDALTAFGASPVYHYNKNYYRCSCCLCCIW